MKMLTVCFASMFGVLSSAASAEVFLNVNGTEYTLTALMENCQTMGDDPAAQVACFNAVSALLDEQTAEETIVTNSSVPEALDALRAAAQYEDADSGLIIEGDACNIHVLYFANYFHISRRNVSSIDLFSSRIDVSQLDASQTGQGAGGQTFIANGVMFPGAVASTISGEAFDSAQYGFAPKTGRSTTGEFAMEVVGQLTPNESAQFNFVLVHPAKQQSSAEIWTALRTLAQACQS